MERIVDEQERRRLHASFRNTLDMMELLGGIPRHVLLEVIEQVLIEERAKMQRH
jgi:hypothetical protein